MAVCRKGIFMPTCAQMRKLRRGEFKVHNSLAAEPRREHTWGSGANASSIIPRHLRGECAIKPIYLGSQ